MARRYFRRYRRGRRYSRRRYAKKRYARGTDRNSFCLTTSENIVYTFKADSKLGMPNKFIDFGIKHLTFGTGVDAALSVMDTPKYNILRRLYDQIRLKGMSVKMSYVADTGLSAQTLNLYTAIDRSTTSKEIEWAYRYGIMANEPTKYLNKVNNAASRKKTSLTGGKTVYFYFFPTTQQEKLFYTIDDDEQKDTEQMELLGFKENTISNFNPCIFSYMEKGAATANTETNVTLNVEVKYYIEFKSSV